MLRSTMGAFTSPPGRRGSGRDAVMRGAVDVLFVDEAGQVSLANVVALAPATTSIVLLGDPQQLDQPMQGAHPPGRRAIGPRAPARRRARRCQPHRGLFLEHTWRLHPEICAFTSNVFYEDRLAAPARTDRQRIVGAGALSGSGSPLAARRRTTAIGTTPRKKSTPSRASSLGCSRAGPSGSTRRTSGTSRSMDDPRRSRPTTPRCAAIDEAPARRARRNGRQVPGPGGADRRSTRWHLGLEEAPHGHGVPVQPPPAQRGDVARTLRGAVVVELPALRVRCRTPAPDAARERALRAARVGSALDIRDLIPQAA